MAKPKTFFVRLLWPIEDATYVAVVPSSPGDYVDAWTLNKFTKVMEKSGVRVSPTDELEGCLYDTENDRNATVGDLQTAINLVRWQIMNLKTPRNQEFTDYDNLATWAIQEPYRFASLIVAETRDKTFYVIDEAPVVSQYAQDFRESWERHCNPLGLQRTDDKEALPAVLRILNANKTM